MDKKYIIILDKNGKRITSLVIGIHADTLEMLIEFAKQNYSDFSYIEADETLQNQLLDPQSVYQNGQVIVLEVDREALKAEQQTQMWEQIKQKRYQNCRSGVYVKSVDKWFHSDDASRQQYTFMRTLPDFPPTQWKTMDNSFVEMTKDLLNELSLAMFAHEQADFANAERHRAAMLAAENPLDYDYSTGWQEVFNG
ncbi:DUF4376 domain-containing protein [Mergibacter septicus]|nr:DUF4376 domain-containing protein [Mergibacter septicus]WMR96322.1 DUF4376 domain-containing protein [Mergibacter septicus]